MATTHFGLPAVEVEQPDGEVICYLVKPVPAPPGVWRSWRVTSPKGDTYLVSEYPSGRWGCNCPASTLGKNRGGRWQKVKARGIEVACCKHCASVHAELAGEAGDGIDQAAPRGRPGGGPPDARRGGEVPPDGTDHAEAADRGG